MDRVSPPLLNGTNFEFSKLTAIGGHPQTPPCPRSPRPPMRLNPSPPRPRLVIGHQLILRALLGHPSHQYCPALGGTFSPPGSTLARPCPESLSRTRQPHGTRPANHQPHNLSRTFPTRHLSPCSKSREQEATLAASDFTSARGASVVPRGHSSRHEW